MKAFYSEKPKQLELMPDGYSKYRWNITEEKPDNGTQWSCNEVNINGAVDSNKVAEQVIAFAWGGGVENKLINDYNEFVLTGENEGAKVAYQNFLSERKRLKDEIKSLFNEAI